MEGARLRQPADNVIAFVPRNQHSERRNLELLKAEIQRRIDHLDHQKGTTPR